MGERTCTKDRIVCGQVTTEGIQGGNNSSEDISYNYPSSPGYQNTIDESSEIFNHNKEVHANLNNFFKRRQDYKEGDPIKVLTLHII